MTPIKDLQAEIAHCESRFDASPGLAFPPIISRLWAQIFHNEITPGRKHAGLDNEWTVKIEYWTPDGKKHAPVRFDLLARKPLLAKLRERDAPDHLIADVDAMTPDILGAMARYRPVGGGTPYCPTQVALLSGHTEGMAAVGLFLLLDRDRIVEVSGFGPGKGKSLWYADKCFSV